MPKKQERKQESKPGPKRDPKQEYKERFLQARAAAIKKADDVLSNVAGNMLCSVAVVLNPKDKTSKDTYSKVIQRFASIHSSDQLKKEVRYLRKVISDSSPKISSLIGEVAAFRANVSKRLANDVKSK